MIKHDGERIKKLFELFSITLRDVYRRGAYKKI